jgi:hypothetical protein
VGLFVKGIKKDMDDSANRASPKFYIAPMQERTKKLNDVKEATTQRKEKQVHTWNNLLDPLVNQQKQSSNMKTMHR